MGEYPTPFEQRPLRESNQEQLRRHKSWIEKFFALGRRVALAATLGKMMTTGVAMYSAFEAENTPQRQAADIERAKKALETAARAGILALAAYGAENAVRKNKNEE